MPSLADLFKPAPTGQDNQWADPNLASPLAQLSRYLSGMDYNVGQNSTGAEGGATGADSLLSNSQFATTSQYDPNQTGMRDSSMQQALATAQQYDPSAHVEYYDPYAGSEGGNSEPMARIVMDNSKLPKAPQMQGGTTLLSNLQTANNQTPDAGQGPHLYNQNAVGMDSAWGPYTSRLNIKEDPDKWTDVGRWGPLAVAAITGGAGAGLLSGFGGMSDAAAQGLVSAATGSGLSGGGFTGLAGLSPNQTINTGFGAVRQAGNPNSTPLSILSSIAPIAGGMLGLPSYATSLARILASQYGQSGKP